MSEPCEVQVVFFASLREAVGTDRVTVQVQSTAELLSALANCVSEDALAALSARNVRVAVNQSLIEGDVALAAGDEVAFLPPVTGG